MEIEYQNKYVVTWCLDRKEGPRICLRAITVENKQRAIEIKCEGFNLELEDTEARDFLNILNQIAASTHFVPDLGVTAEQVSAPYTEEPIIPPPEKSEIAEVTPIVEPTVPDSSEIIQVLKESERTYAEITPSSPDDISIPVTPKVEEPKLPIISESVKEITEEETISPEPPLHHEEPEVISPEIETASFFQQSVTKSPLEMILEEDEGRKVENVPEVSSISEPEELQEAPVTSKTGYTPEDLQTEAFFSQFNTQRTAELIQATEPEPESEPEPEYKRVVQLEPTPKYEKKEHVKTEVERRAEVEKERAERRRRLWELTRGF